MKKKFAYILMGADFIPEKHHAKFETKDVDSYIFTVRDFDEAKEKSLYCSKNGFGVIELCGAFGEENARKIIETTNCEVGVGFVIHLAEQGTLFEKFFSV